MDAELDDVIRLLNRRQKLPQIRNTRSSKSGQCRQKPRLPTPVKASHVIEENLFAEVQDFYKQQDEEYKHTLNSKLGAPLQCARNKADQVKRKYLEFRPFVDPMSLRPRPTEDRGYYYQMRKSDVKLIRFLLEDNGFLEASSKKTNWTILWHGGVIKPVVYQAMTRYQKVNHFPKSYEITRKDLLVKNISRMISSHGPRHYGFIPKSFILPQDAGQLEYEMSVNGGTWIVKPAASSQGKGIFLTTRFGEIPKKEYVVSKYVSNPLLIDGLKFDLRIYVAITSIHPLRIYVYKEGLVRFATQKYSKSAKASRFMHLTNYSVNKHSEHFVENTKATNEAVGSKWSLTALKGLFEKHGMDWAPLSGKINDLVVKTILAIESQMFAAFDMHVPYRTNCFELLGFDILIDDNLTPWLLEVNLSPSLNCDSPLDQKIKGELISDLFTMTGVVSIAARGPKMGQTESGKRKTVKGGSYNRTASSDFAKEFESKDEVAVLRETNGEYKRRGNFERIFPSELSINYKAFFDQERPYNTLVCSQIGKIHRKGGVVYRKPPRASD